MNGDVLQVDVIKAAKPLKKLDPRYLLVVDGYNFGFTAHHNEDDMCRNLQRLVQESCRIAYRKGVREAKRAGH